LGWGGLNQRDHAAQQRLGTVFSFSVKRVGILVSQATLDLKPVLSKIAQRRLLFGHRINQSLLRWAARFLSSVERSGIRTNLITQWRYNEDLEVCEILEHPLDVRASAFNPHNNGASSVESDFGSAESVHGPSSPSFSSQRDVDSYRRECHLDIER